MAQVASAHKTTVQLYARTGKPVLSNPVAKVSGQVNGLEARDLTGAVLSVEELLDEVVADHWQEVSVAHGTVLGLRDENFFLVHDLKLHAVTNDRPLRVDFLFPVL